MSVALLSWMADGWVGILLFFITEIYVHFLHGKYFLKVKDKRYQNVHITISEWRCNGFFFSFYFISYNKNILLLY